MFPSAPVSCDPAAVASSRFRLAFIAVAITLMAVPAPAGAQNYGLSLLVHASASPPGDPIPEPAFPVYGDEYYDSVGGPLCVNNLGLVAFPTIIGNSAYPGLFTDDGPGGRLVAVQFLPGPPDLHGWIEASPVTSSTGINDSGQVAYWAYVSAVAPVATEAIILDDDGPGLTIATDAQVAPSAGGGYFTHFTRPSLNQAGEVAFAASVRLGSLAEGLFLHAGGSVAAVLLQGDAAPGTGGGAYAGFSAPVSYNAISLAPALNDLGAVAFRATVSGGTATEGVFTASGGGSTQVALQGEAAPGTGGGAYVGFSNVALTNGGTVAYRATVSGGTAGEGLFINAGGVPMVVALQGDEAPGTAGGAFSFFYGISLNEDGALAFKADVSGGASSQGIFVYDPASQRIRSVALAGETIPGSETVTFTGFSDPAINDLGQVAFTAQLSSGPSYRHDSNLYLASPVPEAGSFSLLGAALIGALLRRRARRSRLG